MLGVARGAGPDQPGLIGQYDGLGAVGSLLGIPLGVAGYHMVVPRMADAVDITLPAYMTDVWQAPAPAALGLAGVGIAVLGAFVPARRAGRLTVAEVLRSE